MTQIASTTGGTVPVPANPSTPATIVGQYGTLVIGSDGSYTYQVDTANPAVAGLPIGGTISDVFTYTISDGNGGTATTTLTVPITRLDKPPVAVDDAVVGLAAGYTAGSMSIELQAHVAVGETTRTVSIDGATQIVSPFTGSATFLGGLLAQRTNIGVFRSSDWAVVPDLDLTVGWWLTSHCRLLLGYSILYWPGVARAGEQIDFGLNPSQLPPGTLVGPARPAFALHRSDLWAQGFSAGVEIRY